MRITVIMEVDLRHRALIGGADCCEAGHPDAAEAAQHAWILTQALARHRMTGNAALRGGCRNLRLQGCDLRKVTIVHLRVSKLGV